MHNALNLVSSWDPAMGSCFCSGHYIWVVFLWDRTRSQLYVWISCMEHIQGFIEILHDWKFNRDNTPSRVFKDGYI